MKSKMKLLSVLLMTLFVVNTASAQRGMNMEKGMADCPRQERMGKGGGCNLPDLTDKQKEDMKTLHTQHKKEMLGYQNQMGELKAKLKTLETADKADMAKINSTIDEMAKVKTEMAKKRAAHKQQIRGMLTDEQRLAFDTRPRRGGKRGGGRGYGGGGCNK